MSRRDNEASSVPVACPGNDRYLQISRRVAEPQRGSGRAVTVKAGRPGYERLTVALTVGGFVVAVVGVVRDFVAG